MTTTIRSSADGSKSYIAVGGTDRVTIDAATGKLTSTYSPPTGERSLALATMQKFADEFGASLAANGYQKLPSGLIIQWGTTGSIANSSSAAITFPVAFPNAVFEIMRSENATASYTGGSASWLTSKTVAGVTINHRGFDTYTGSMSYFWLAIGY